MYVCPKIYIPRALSKKVTVAPRSQTNRNVFSARLNRSVDKSAERTEDRRLFQIRGTEVLFTQYQYIEVTVLPCYRDSANNRNRFPCKRFGHFSGDFRAQKHIDLSDHWAGRLSGIFKLTPRYQICRVIPSLTKVAFRSLMQAFIYCRLDHCNAVLAESADILTKWLQSVQDTAARFVCWN